MSYTIEYNSTIFFTINNDFFTLDKDPKTYYLFQRLGDNNVWNRQNNSRHKEWYFVQSSSEPELWKTIGIYAGSVEGGDLQRAVGWTDTKYFSIEEYVARYRTKIRNAKPLTTFFDTFNATVTIFLRETFAETQNQPSESLIRDMITQYNLTPTQQRDWLDKTKRAYNGPITTLTALKTFLNTPQNSKDYRLEYHVTKRRSAY